MPSSSRPTSFLPQPWIDSRQLGAWSTTTANLWGVLALERFSAKFESAPVAGKSTLSVGAATRAVDWKAAPEGSTESLPWGPALLVRHEGSGKSKMEHQTGKFDDRVRAAAQSFFTAHDLDVLAERAQKRYATPLKKKTVSKSTCTANRVSVGVW